MDPTQNQSGTPGPIFSAGPAPEEPPMAPEPSGTGPKNPFSRGGGDIILQPNDNYSSGTKTRSKKPLIIGAIAVIIIIVVLLIVLPIIRGGNGEKTVDESKVKPAVYSYINYLVYGEESDSYKDVSSLLSNYSSSNISLIYADSMLYSNNKKTYFETLDKKLDDLAVIYEETYDTGMSFEAIRTYYLDFANVANSPEADILANYAKNGASFLDSVADITTNSDNEDIVRYVEVSNQIRKAYVAGLKDAYENGCYVNYNSNDDTYSESKTGCFNEIQFNNYGTYDTSNATKEQIEQSLKQDAIDELNILLNQYYGNKG